MMEIFISVKNWYKNNYRTDTVLRGSTLKITLMYKWNFHPSF
jgi:hypothetical protein